MAKTAFKMRFG